MVARGSGLDAATVAAMTPPYFNPNGLPNRDSMTYCYQFFRDQGLITQPIPEATLQTLFGTLRVSPANRPYAEVLVQLVATNLKQVDEIVLDALTNWRMERLAAIDRNVLRLGVAEMLFVDDVPPRITIREMMQLAEKYGTTESPRFVNGVLDALYKRVAPER